MNDIDSVGKVSILREISHIAPEPEDEDKTRNPKNIQSVPRDPLVEEKQARRNQEDTSEMRLQPVEIEQKQYSGAEIHKFRRELNLQFRIYVPGPVK